MQISTLSSATGQPATANGKANLEKAAQQFEAIFLRQMIGAMRSASLSDGLTDTAASDQFRDMADARTADAMAQKGAMGIAELLLKQLGSKVPATTAPMAPDGPAPAEGE